MSITDSINEIQKGLDKLIPPKKEENQKYDYHHINVSVPNPIIQIESKDLPIAYLDIIAAIAMASGFICLGFALHGL